MAGVMALRSRDDAVSLLDSVKFAIEVPSKLHHLSRFKRDLSSSQSDLLLPQLLQLLSDRSSPVRKLVTQIIGEIGSKHVHLLPEIVPALLAVLQDAAPAVSRQAITCALDLFRSTLGRVAVQGLVDGKLEDSLESSWSWMLKLKEKIYSIASQPGNDGIRLLALKFVQAIILLYTPDPNGSSEPPSQETFEGKLVEFNISWFRGGHPLLDMGDLSIEASQNLDSLLDHLRLTEVKSLSNYMIIVLINGLSAIANKRPAFYGRILPVLLGLNPASTVIKGVHVSAARHALKNAFLSCLKCTHPGALPWRDRLAGALGQMEGGHLEGETFPAESKLNGQTKEEINDLPIKEGEKPSVKSLDVVHGNANGKRLGGQDIFQSTVDIGSGKRVKTTPIVSEGLSKELNKDINVQDDASSTGRNTSQGDGVNGPVQQLVAMFGALVAQGDKAASSLEILISSISSDLLAEVVIANMRNHPHDFSSSERIMGNDGLGKIPSSISADILSLSIIFPQMVSQLDDQPMESIEVSKSKREEECFALTSANSVEVCGAKNVDTEAAVVNSVPVISTSVLASGMENDYSIIPHEIQDVGNLDSGIPGLDAIDHSEGFPNTLVASSLASTDLEDGSQAQASGVNRSPHDQLPSVSTDRSEEFSPKASVTDANSTISSSATSVGMSYQILLPKMSAPVIDLADERKVHLQNLAFSRIIEAYKQISLGGCSRVHFCLLASLGVQFPLELDPWKLLQKHILSDYVNHEGHELTLHVLYRLFSEAEEERDFFSSATASSSYDMFLGTVAETLRDSFPASDKSLSRLLSEVPYLPQSIFKLLQCMCSPENNDKDDKGLQCGDRVTQGLFAVWSLILIRPSIRNVCLKIALKSAVHNLEEVRMKAIRLVANKLYPMISISQHIEEFALENLFSVLNGSTIDRADVERIGTESHRDSNLEKPVDEHKSLSVCTKDVPSETESCVSESMTSSSISEAQRCMSLYFALCTKKHSLFRQILVIYRRMSEAAKQAVDRHIPILVRTIGSSPDLLEIISDPPIGSENLLMQVLCTLTDGVVPSPALTFTIKKLYDSKLQDIEILMPILPFLPKEEVLQIFPKIVNVPQQKFQAALSCVMQGSIQSGPVLTPAEVLIAIHGIDPERDGIPLKKITDACNACFEQRKLFTQQVIAMVLNQLVEQIPLPLLFMRTVLQAIGFFPALVDFIMEILCRLVSKQIWKHPKLWVGFLKCAFLTKPQSFSVLLQLPPAQLENALNKNAALKAPLVAHVNQSDVRSTLPRSLLGVLGVASDSQTSSQTEVTQTQPDARSPAKEVIAEKTVESSSAS